MSMIPPMWLALWGLGAAPLELGIAPLIVSNDDNVTPKIIYDVARQTAESFERVRVPRYDTWLTAGPQANLTALRDCGTNAICVYRVFDRSGYGFGIVLSLDLSLRTPILTTTFMDVKNRSVLQEHAQIYRPNSLQDTVRTWIHQHLRYISLREAGTLQLNLTPAEAHVKTPPELQSDPRRPHKWKAAAGLYTLHLQHPGYDPQTLDIVLTPDTPQILDVQLNRTSAWYESPWLWVAASAVVVAAATVLFVTKPFPSNESPITCFRSGDSTCP